MSSIIIACSGAKHIAKKLAAKLRFQYSELEIHKFPDNEIDIRFLKPIKRKKVYLVQSFYADLNQKIIETLFAAHTAKDLGAKKINLIAPFFPYLRKDKRFKPGECISAKVMQKLFKIFNKIYIAEPHLHRIKKIKKAMPNGIRISTANEIAKYIQKLPAKNYILIGPDIESKQWVDVVAKILKKKPIILRKIRYGARKVKIKPIKLPLKNRNLIIIDDMISTGHTMLETIKQLKKLKPRKIYCIATHGIFAENAIKKLRKYCQVIVTNTIPSSAAKIDITKAIAKLVK